MAEAFKIIFDHAQKRIERDRLFLQVTGKYPKDPYSDSRDYGWDQSYTTLDGNGDAETWWEPITGKLMLNPLCNTKRWQEIRTGNYARLLKANLTFATAGDWQDVDFSNAGGIAVALKDGQRLQVATTSTSYDANRAFYFAPVFYSTGNDGSGYFECAFNGFGTGVEFRFYTSGRAEVRKAGVLVGVYTWTAPDQQGTGKKVDGQRVSFMIFPMPAAQVVVVTNEGGGFHHLFDDLDPQGEDNEVTPPGAVSFRCDGMNTNVELAPIMFQTEGSGYTVVSYFKDPPEPEDTPNFTNIKSGSGTMSVGIRAPDGGTYAHTRDCRLIVNLSGSGTTSYYVGAVTCEYPRTITEMPDEEYDVTAFVLSDPECGFTSSMAPGSNELRFTLKGGRQVPVDPEDMSLGTMLEELDPDDALQIRTMENRAVKLVIGDVVVMDGIAGPPSYDQASNREADRIHFTVRDKQWVLLDEYRFTDPTALDAYTLQEGLEIPIAAAGNDEAEYEIDDEAAGVLMELSAMYSMGDWALQAMPRHTGTRLLHEIHDQYIGDWFMQTITTADGPKLKIASIDTMGDTAILVIYDDAETARGELTEIDWRGRVCRSFNKKLTPLETDQMFVHGLDPVHRRPFIGKWEDLDAQDATKSVAERNPDRWCGTIRKAALNAPGLRTETALRTCGEKLWRKVSWRRTVVEWDSELLIHPDDLYPLFPGHCIEIAPHGTFRIQGMRLSLRNEPPDAESEDFPERPCHYVGELIQDRDDAKGLGHIRQKATSIAGLLMESMDRLKKGNFDIENSLKPIWNRFDGQD